MTTYTGIGVQRLKSDNSIYSVSVKDQYNNLSYLDPSDYVAKGCQPDLDSLPTIPSQSSEIR